MKYLVTGVSIALLTCAGFFWVYSLSRAELSQSECTKERNVEIPLPQTSLRLAWNTKDRIVIDFSVNTGNDISGNGENSPQMVVIDPESDIPFVNWLKKDVFLQNANLKALPFKIFKHESKLYDFNPKSFELKPSELVPFGHKVEAVFCDPTTNSFNMVLSKKDKFSAHFIGEKEKFVVELPDDRQKEIPIYQRQFGLLGNEKYLLVTEGSRLMRWSLDSGNPKKLVDFVLPDCGGYPADLVPGTNSEQMQFLSRGNKVKALKWMS